MGTPFIKMHGLGNDFAIFDAREAEIPMPADRVRLLAWDLPGLGLSRLPPGGRPSLDSYAADLRGLVLRAHTRVDAVDAQLRGDAFGDGFGVAGDHHDLDPAGVQHLDGLAGFPAHLISKFESSNQLSVTGDMQDDCAVGAPAISDGQFLMALFLEHAGPAHPHCGALDASGHTDRR